MTNLIIYPSSYFQIRKIDEDLQGEYDAAVATGLFDIVLFGYDQWFQKGKRLNQCKCQMEQYKI